MPRKARPQTIKCFVSRFQPLQLLGVRGFIPLSNKLRRDSRRIHSSQDIIVDTNFIHNTIQYKHIIRTHHKRFNTTYATIMTQDKPWQEYRRWYHSMHDAWIMMQRVRVGFPYFRLGKDNDARNLLWLNIKGCHVMGMGMGLILFGGSALYFT